MNKPKVRQTSHGKTVTAIVDDARWHLARVHEIETRNRDRNFPPMDGDGEGIIGHLILARRRMKEARACLKEALKDEMKNFHPHRLDDSGS